MIEARYGAKAPAEARSRVRLRLYPPSDRFCRNCAAFVPDRAEAILAEAPPTFREVTKWLSPAAMATNASGALDGNAQRAWKNLGECTRDPDEGMLVHPNGPDCGRWR